MSTPAEQYAQRQQDLGDRLARDLHNSIAHLLRQAYKQGWADAMRQENPPESPR